MKKKVFILLFAVLSLFIITACVNDNKVKTKKKTNIETEKDKYIKYVKELKKVKKSSEELPFTVEILYEQKDEEVEYQVIIDNPTKEIKEISAIAVHNKQTDDVFPSVGIFDNEVDLIPNETPSGVILVGYIPYDGEMEDFDIEIKVLIDYNIDDKEFKSYYVTKK